MEKRRPDDGLKSVKLLSDADFVESIGYLEPRSLDPDTCLLIIAHTNLYGTESQNTKTIVSVHAISW
jgi:hypothetical protein